ncbi:methyl-accepting chemotaxis protein [Thermosynechococcus sp. M55_K2018_012]|uniref:methyl-accepting chemotaxis protein n=1 Tax=Thermosynechococcus sp. M55_K2018_012 TaxID=2747809 RepID=UPI0025F910DD|nr:methyl-accepting chemotaxis protein [Thermosynechococcus sp. M55_K2018_012]
MRIRSQLYSLMGAISFMALTSLGMILFNLSGEDAVVVNEAGLVRGGTQRIVKLRLAGANIDELIARNDRRINALINGDAEMGIPPARNPKFRNLMLEVQSKWQQLREQLQQPKINIAQLIQDSEDFFKLTDDTVKVAEVAVKESNDFIKITEIVIIALEVILVIIVLLTIKRIISLLSRLSTQIATSSNETAAALAEQEKVIAQQAASVNQTTTTMEELGASSRQSAEQAEASAAGAKQAMELATYGKETVEQTVQGIEALRGNVMAIAEKIMQLSEQTTQVTAISELVADIANQTNILALNAAVEAARAGEHGKGFSVVAQEVRKLADQSKKSAEKITTLIREVQAAMNGTVMVTDEGMKATNECAKLAHATSETFATIANAIDAVHLNSQQIALSSKQQAVGVQQAISAMNAINLGAQETATSVSQIKTATRQLVEAAETLQNSV